MASSSSASSIPVPVIVYSVWKGLTIQGHYDTDANMLSMDSDDPSFVGKDIVYIQSGTNTMYPISFCTLYRTCAMVQTMVNDCTNCTPESITNDDILLEHLSQYMSLNGNVIPVHVHPTYIPIVILFLEIYRNDPIWVYRSSPDYKSLDVYSTRHSYPLNVTASERAFALIIRCIAVDLHRTVSDQKEKQMCMKHILDLFQVSETDTYETLFEKHASITYASLLACTDDIQQIPMSLVWDRIYNLHYRLDVLFFSKYLDKTLASVNMAFGSTRPSYLNGHLGSTEDIQISIEECRAKNACLADSTYWLEFFDQLPMTYSQNEIDGRHDIYNTPTGGVNMSVLLAEAAQELKKCVRATWEPLQSLPHRYRTDAELSLLFIGSDDHQDPYWIGCLFGCQMIALYLNCEPLYQLMCRILAATSKGRTLSELKALWFSKV